MLGGSRGQNTASARTDDQATLRIPCRPSLSEQRMRSRIQADKLVPDGAPRAIGCITRGGTHLLTRDRMHALVAQTDDPRPA